MMAVSQLELKLDAQVMLIKNIDEELVNGSIGRVIGFSDIASAAQDTLELARDAGASPTKSKVPKPGVKYPLVQFSFPRGGKRTVLMTPELFQVDDQEGKALVKREQLPLIRAFPLERRNGALRTSSD